MKFDLLWRKLSNKVPKKLISIKCTIFRRHFTECLCTFEFSGNYTKLAMLSFFYCFVVKGKLI